MKDPSWIENVTPGILPSTPHVPVLDLTVPQDRVFFDGVGFCINYISHSGIYIYFPLFKKFSTIVDLRYYFALVSGVQRSGWTFM